MNKKQDQMHFFPSKKQEKRKWLINCVIKWGNQFSISIRNFLKMFIMQCNREKTLELR